METKEIDWEQRRFEITKVVIQGCYSNPNIFGMSYKIVANTAIKQADEAIAKLKEYHD